MPADALRGLEEPRPTVLRRFATVTEIPSAHVWNMGPESAVGVADVWLRELLVNEDLSAAWNLMDEPLRRVLAQDRIIGSGEWPEVAARDRDDLAASLAAGATTDPMWPAFAESILAEWRVAFAIFREEGWGFSTQPRPVALDFELVVAAAGSSTGHVSGPTLIENALPILMHSTVGGWRVSNYLGEALKPPLIEPTPGWPPSMNWTRS